MGFTASLFVHNGADARQSDRRAVDSLSTLRAHSLAADVHVTDLSRTGCAIVSSADLPLGTEISIGLVGFGAFDAQIVRRDGETYGCEFAEPISADIVANAFTASNVIATPIAPMFEEAARAVAEPEAQRWSPALRMMLVIGSSAALWYGIVSLAVSASA